MNLSTFQSNRVTGDAMWSDGKYFGVPLHKSAVPDRIQVCRVE